MLVFQGPQKPDFYAQLTCAPVVIATKFPTLTQPRAPLQRTILLCASGITLNRVKTKLKSMLAFQDEDAVSWQQSTANTPKGNVLVYPTVVFKYISLYL